MRIGLIQYDRRHGYRGALKQINLDQRAVNSRLDAALDRLGAGWLLRRYPWAGSLSTAHSVYWYEKFGPGVFRDLAQLRIGLEPYGARTGEAKATFDLAQVAASDARELKIWHHLVRERRHVSRAAYQALADETAPLRPRPRRYTFRAGVPPVAGHGPAKGRRPRNSSNAAG